MLIRMLQSELAARLRLAFDDDREADTFLLRLDRYGPDLLRQLRRWYGSGTEALLDQLLELMVHEFHNRAPDLRRLDEARLLWPDWWLRPQRVGYSAPVGPWVGSLRQIAPQLSYLQELGVDLLHLHGLVAEGEARQVAPELGSLNELGVLSRELRQRGLRLGLHWPLSVPAEPAPEVCRQQLEALLLWANRGIELFELGQAYPGPLLGALRACLRIVAPAVTVCAAPGFSAAQALGQREDAGLLCDLAQWPRWSSALWLALAQGEAAALAQALQALPSAPAGTGWIWALEGPLGELSGLDAALSQGEGALALASQRLRLIYSLWLGLGGLPLLRMGDELGITVQHGAFPWDLAQQAQADTRLPAGWLLAWWHKLVQVRQITPQLHAAAPLEVLESPQPALLALRRTHPMGPLVQLYNLSAAALHLPSDWIRNLLGAGALDLLSGQRLPLVRPQMRLEAFQALWLREMTPLFELCQSGVSRQLP